MESSHTIMFDTAKQKSLPVSGIPGETGARDNGGSDTTIVGRAVVGARVRAVVGASVTNAERVGVNDAATATGGGS